jgi:hypothetical protein
VRAGESVQSVRELPTGQTKPELNRVIAFSSEVDTGSRQENASTQQSGDSVLIQPEPNLQADILAVRPT